MDWPSLPNDLQETVLDHVSLVELTKGSTLGNAFQNAFCRKLKEVQKARCGLANKTVGYERIQTIAAITTGFMEGHFPGPEVSKNAAQRWWICPDGKLYADGEVPYDTVEVEGRIRDCRVWATLEGSPPVMLEITLSRGGMRWTVRVYCDDMSRFVSVYTYGDEDLEGSAFIQALFSYGFAASGREAWPPARVRINAADRRFPRLSFTDEGLQAQMAPLLPLAAMYTVTDYYNGGLETVKEIQEGVSTANRDMSLNLFFV